MATGTILALESPLAMLWVRGAARKVNNNHGRLRNRSTGQLEEIILVDPQDSITENLIFSSAAVSSETRADLAAALNAFSPVEKRIILRVLVQGQTVMQATAKMKGSARKWQRWFSTEALPVLQAALDDYREELKRVGFILPLTDPYEGSLSDLDDPQQSPEYKCKFCPHVESAFTKLRAHVAEEHASTFEKVDAYVREKDYEIGRDALLLKEVRAPGEEEVE